MIEVATTQKSSACMVHWAGKIRLAWQKSVAGIVECGQLLIDAKTELAHGEFGAMCAHDLPFSAQTAQKLMAVAGDLRISNTAHVRLLPPSWGTLYELTKLDDGQWASAVEAGVIRPDMERKEILELRKAGSRHTQVGALPSTTTCTTADLTGLTTRFGCIYADPPWDYGNQATRASTGNHYEGLSVDEICALPIEGLAADDAHLHLWTTNAFLFEAKRVMEAWGFEYKSCFIWVKPQMGMGNYWRVSHEFLLFGIRGKAAFENRALMSWGEFDRAAHSAKPEQVRQMIETASPSPRLELFGRQKVDGWTVWGNQIERNLFHQEAA